MENLKFFEFQSKGSHVVQFNLKKPDLTSATPDQKLRQFKDGERVIAKLLETEVGNFFKIEDTEGNTAVLPVKNFHKITDIKSFSKKFLMFKQLNRILD